jgi:hypothetical protein
MNRQQVHFIQTGGQMCKKLTKMRRKAESTKNKRKADL